MCDGVDIFAGFIIA